MMERKLALMVEYGGIALLLVRPSAWRDQFGSRLLPPASHVAYRTLAVPLLGRHEDPHRPLYCTLAFGMRRFRPHVIHTEEEPDSLAALHICVARRFAAPRAQLVLQTYQNVIRPMRSRPDSAK